LQVTAKEIVDVGGQTVSNTLSPDAWTAVATDQRGYSCDAERLTLFFSVGGTSVSNIYRRSSPAPSGLPSAAPPGQPSLSPPVGPSGGTGSATCGSHDGLVTFCGSATIVVTVGGKTLRFEHGTCDSSGPVFAVQAGTLQLGTTTPSLDYFGMALVSKKDGTYHQAGDPSWVKDGTYFSQAFFSVGTIVVSGGGTRGTFSGHLDGSGAAYSGSFTCA